MRVGTATVLAICAVMATSCGWRGLNSLPMPATEGRGPGSYTVQVQLPDVNNLQPNNQVRVGDVNVGTVAKIERQGWHALLTIRLNGNVDLPANATAALGQTSLLGSQHIELAPPTEASPEGKLREGSLIPLSAAASFPTTEQTLTAVSLLLNGGGVVHVQDITEALASAFTGRDDDLRGLINQLDIFVGTANSQSEDIIGAVGKLNELVDKFAAQEPVITKALQTIPKALAVLGDHRHDITEAADQVGKLSALAADAIDQTKDALVQEINDLGPVLKSLADAGPALTRAVGFYSTYPFARETISNWFRGDYANLTAVIDLTLSRLDSSFFTGTRWECNLTELEMQWGRTIGQLPSPCTSGGPFNQGNPLVIPYHFDQGP
ncbi:MCE family protein [Mycobacterium sp. 1274756.6]|uniref:MCE family protein n=1 Tax=Mycobacterium sp. 1274756.6 TaxID=1834076 RepID=UPI0018D4A78A|nr:MCE family protein [Mycobacterium sp. 1274756.6]